MSHLPANREAVCWKLRSQLTRKRIQLERQMEQLHKRGECEIEGVLCALFVDIQHALNQLEDMLPEGNRGVSLTRWKMGGYPDAPPYH